MRYAIRNVRRNSSEYDLNMYSWHAEDGQIAVFGTHVDYSVHAEGKEEKVQGMFNHGWKGTRGETWLCHWLKPTRATNSTKLNKAMDSIDVSKASQQLDPGMDPWPRQKNKRQLDTSSFPYPGILEKSRFSWRKWLEGMSPTAFEDYNMCFANSMVHHTSTITKYLRRQQHTDWILGFWVRSRWSKSDKYHRIPLALLAEVS